MRSHTDVEMLDVVRGLVPSCTTNYSRPFFPANRKPHSPHSFQASSQATKLAPAAQSATGLVSLRCSSSPPVLQCKPPSRPTIIVDCSGRGAEAVHRHSDGDEVVELLLRPPASRGSMSLTEGTIKAFLSATSKLQDITEGEKHALQHVASWLSSRGGAALPGDAFDEELANQDEETQDLAAAFTSCSLRGSLVALQKWSSKTANPRSRSERTSDSGSGPLAAFASHNPELLAKLSKLGSWEFDVFAVDSLSDGHALEAVGMAALQQQGLIEELALPLDKLRNFLRAVEKQYLRNPYHCSMHAADVVQTLTAIVCMDKLRDVLTPLELLALTVAAIIHDMGHQGVSNDFHVQTGSEWAVTYNDQSPNENYHVAAAWKTLCKPHNDFLCHLPKEQRQFLRSVVVELVLATDMKLHHSLLNDLKADVALFGTDLSTWGASARAHLLAFVLHCADIGNCVKPLDKSERWAKLVNEEFWEQGDKERSLGLPLSTLNDRHTANIPRSQKFFLELFGKPSYEVLGHLAPVTGALATQHYAANLAHWEELIARGVTTL